VASFWKILNERKPGNYAYNAMECEIFEFSFEEMQAKENNKKNT